MRFMGKLLKIDPVVIENESYPYSGKTHFGHDPGSGRTTPWEAPRIPWPGILTMSARSRLSDVLATSSFF